jgi:DNA-binding winged helix-turn-helix (wHTH) protein
MTRAKTGVRAGVNSKCMELVRFGAFAIDVERKQLLHDGIPVNAPAQTVDLIAYLIEQDGKVVSKQELAAMVWRRDFVEPNNIVQHVHMARAALRDLRKPHVYIQTIARRGYRFSR